MQPFVARAAIPFLLLIFAPGLQAGSPPHHESARRVAQAMIEDLQAVSGVPGLSAAVWQDGAIAWTGAAGLRDVAADLPVTAETRFRLASVSKLFAVTAAAKLAEQGKLDLDAPVTFALPWLANGWAPITARQLAAHSSGLPHYQHVDVARGAKRYPTGRDAVGIFADRPLLSPPGERYSYSSWGYTLLGAMVEAASGHHFGDYVQREIAPGLDVGLDATGSDPRASVAYEFANKVATPAAPHDFSYTWGGGGMMASARELARFGGAMLADRVVSRASFDRMLVPMPLNSGKLAGEDGFSVGFGWRIGADGHGRPTAFHNGTAIGARSSLVLWREEGVAAALLSNASWVSSIDKSAEMLAAPFRAPEPGAGLACPIDATRYGGRFGGVAVSGAARFAVRNGICQGELQMAPPMTVHFSAGPQPGGYRLTVVSLSADQRLGRAGLVTPFGIYDLRTDTAARSHTSVLSPSREFTFTLTP